MNPKNILYITAALGLIMSAHADTPITALPCIINTPGIYYLTSNLTGTPGQSGFRILITASNVLLDLKHFTLANAGITIQGNDVIVKNGTIAGIGVLAYPTGDIGTVSGITIDHVTFNDVSGTTIGFFYINASSVTYCSFYGPTEAGIYDYKSQPTNCVKNRFDGKQNIIMTVVYPPNPVVMEQAKFVPQ
jgi:hypothetical protein